jgi:hypothetical protein
VKNSISKGQRQFEVNVDEDGNTTEHVSVNADTQVYLVYGKGTDTTITKVDAGTGYAAIPALAGKGLNAVYAVATSTRYNSSDKAYPVADVLVIEINNTYEESVIFSYQQFKTDVDSILLDATLDTVSDLNDVYTAIDFYDTVNGVPTNVTTNYKANKIVAAVLDRVKNLSYLEVYKYSNYDGVKDTAITTIDLDNLTVYAINDVRGTLSAEELAITDLRTSDKLIITPNYIIDVSRSDSSVIKDLEAVYNKIVGQAATTHDVIIDGAVVATVKDGESYKTPAAATGTPGTGYKVTGANVDYVAYEGTITNVKADITLEGGYVAWTLNDKTTVAVAYETSGTTISSELTLTGNYVRLVKKNGTVTAIRAKSNGTNNADADAEFVDGLYKVETTTATGKTIGFTGVIYDADGKLVGGTALTPGSTYYAAVGAEITTYINGKADTTITITAGSNDYSNV